MKPLVLALSILTAWPAFAISQFPLHVTPSVRTLHTGKGVVSFKVTGPNDETMQARVLSHEGRRVVTLQRVAENLLVWDGRDAAGRPVKPGTYLIEIVEEPFLWNGAVTVER